MSMPDPFGTAPSGFDRIQDHAAHAMIVTPREYLTGLTTVHSKAPGDADAVDLDLVVLKEDGTFQEMRLIRVYSGGLVSQFRRAIGQMLIGRLGKTPTPKGEAWIFNAASDADRQLGIRYLQAKEAAKLQNPAPAAAPRPAMAGSAPASTDPFA